jgi:predicted TIM-barrel fold metal-dependent hydrolase
MAECIDAHAHLLGMDRDGHGCVVSAAMRRRVSTRFVLRRIGARRGDPPREVDRRYLDFLVDQAEAAPSVDRIVLLALDGVCGPDGRIDEGRTHLRVPNGFVLEACRASRKFLPGCSVNPLRSDAVAELERCAAAGAVLCKWIPASMGFDPADPRCGPFYAALRRLGMPLLSHVGTEFAVTTVERAHGDLGRLDAALDAGATVIVPHAGNLRLLRDAADWEDLRARLARRPNLRIDDSALCMVHRRRRLLRILEAPEIHGSVIHGSDFPLPPQPLAFADRIGLRAARRVASLPSLFERDVALKRAVGAPDAFLAGAAGVLRMPAPGRDSGTAPE